MGFAAMPADEFIFAIGITIGFSTIPDEHKFQNSSKP